MNLIVFINSVTSVQHADSTQKPPISEKYQRYLTNDVCHLVINIQDPTVIDCILYIRPYLIYKTFLLYV